MEPYLAQLARRLSKAADTAAGNNDRESEALLREAARAVAGANLAALQLQRMAANPMEPAFDDLRPTYRSMVLSARQAAFDVTKGES